MSRLFVLVTVCLFDSTALNLKFNSYCVDIDECDSKNGGCEQICVNLKGKPNACMCKRGYTKHPEYSTRCIGKGDIVMTLL